MLADDHVPGTHAVLAPAGEFIFDRVYSVIDHYPPAGFQSGYAGAGAGNNPRYVRSAPVRHFKIEARPSPHHPYIQVIQGTCLDFDKDLACTWSGIGNVIVFKYIQIAMLVKTESFHDADLKWKNHRCLIRPFRMDIS
jgi:hypothetical protein